MSFAAGIIAGVVAAALLVMFVAKARVISGETDMRLPDFRTVIAVLALVIAIIALVRSGHTTSASTTTPTSDSTGADDTIGTAPTTVRATASTIPGSTTTSPGVTEVTVPNVIGMKQTDAIAKLQSVGLVAKLQQLPLNSVPAGFVVTESPDPLSRTTTRALVELGVSAAA